MARGYLGKISAVISANTGDYVRKLNESAKETAAFARTVQQTLGRASSEASKSLDGIYTPLQKVERALRAAASQKLAFRGFDGAIRDVQSLQSAIAKLTDEKTIDLVVKTSGVGSLDELKRTIGVLRNQDVTIGVEGLRQQRTALGNTKNFVVKTEVREEGKRLDDVIEALERIDTESLKKISLQVEAQQLDAAALKLRQLVSAGKEIGEPLERAAKQYASLSLSVQAAFGPALKRAQQATESLTAAIDSGATISQRKFAALRREVELTEAAVKRLDAAESVISRLGDGRSLRDVAPRQFDALNAAAAVQQRSSALSGQAAAGFGVGRQEAAVRRQAEILNQMRARQESLRQSGGDTSEIDAAIERQTARLEKQVAVWQRLVAAAEDYEQIVALRSKGGFVSSEDLASTGRRKPDDSTPLTGNRDPRTRVLGQLGQEVGDLRNRLRGVGETLAGDIGPTVDNLTTRFQNMARQGVGVAAEDARRLAQEVAGINAALNNRQSIGERFESSFGGAGRAGLSLGVDERSLRAIGGQIEFVQGRLSALGQEARGPVIAALDALRTRANQLFQGGALDTEEGRRELQLLREELIRTLSAAGGGSEARIEQSLARVGDVARGSFGNAGLAIQQAAFAFEDFFSVTGGLDQRIRAAGNNISQLGFILGGTTGLIVGIAAAIGGQLVAAIIRWYNEGRTAEDQTKALNDALARQKSLVEDLKQAFESLGDAIAGRAFSEPAQQARKFAKELEDVAKKQRELRESRVSGLDENVQRERTEQNRINRELQTETDPGRRVLLQRQLNESQQRERTAAAAAVSRRVTGEDVGAAIERAIIRATTSGMSAQEQRQNAGAVAEAAAEVRRGIPTGSSAADIQAQREAIRNQIAIFRPRAQQGDRGSIDAIAELTRVLNSLELPLQKALDELSNSILRASQAASLEIESAQADVADAIRRGVPGAALLQQNLDNIANELDAAQQRLRDAQESDSPDREQQIRLAQRDIDGIRARQDGIAEASRDISLTSGRGGERTTAALSALRGNERFSNEYGGLIGALRARIRDEAEARLQQVKAIASGSDADKAAANAAYEAAAAASDLAAAAAEAAMGMEEALGRIRKLAESAVSQSEQIADNAQRDLTQNPTEANRQARDDAEIQLIEDRKRIAQANNALDARRSELQREDPSIQSLNDALKRIENERKRLEDEATKSGTLMDPEQARAIADNEASLLAQREERLYELTEAERRQIDAINEEIAARQRMIDFAKELERRQNPVGDPISGLDLLERPGQRAARELNQQLADAEAATRERVAARLDRVDADFAESIRNAENIEEGMQSVIDRINDLIADGVPDDPRLAEETRDAVAAELQTLQETRKRLLVDQMRNTAPGLFSLADSVANAVLQGPSRAALQATDVSTVEGSRELTRLLRGDDAAKDQANLVELQKEANRLLDLIANAPAPVAN